MDNLFSGDEVLRYLGEGGWKGMMTCRRNRQPKAVPKKYFNFVKTAPVNTRSKVARFENPIVAVKHVKQPDSKQPNSAKHIHLVYLVHRSPNLTHFVVNQINDDCEAYFPAEHHKKDITIDKENIDANANLFF